MLSVVQFTFCDKIYEPKPHFIQLLNDRQPNSFKTPFTLSSVCIFSILFSMHFLRFWQGEFVLQQIASLVGDHFLHSRNL